MPVISMPGVQLKWRCRRCGKDDGVAKSMVPLPGFMTDGWVRQGLLDQLTPKVLRYHLVTDKCSATIEDIDYQPVRRSLSKSGGVES